MMATYTNAFEVDFETLGSIKSCLETSAPHRSRSESSSIREKKKKSNRLSVDGSIHVGTLTRPMCMGRRVRLTVRVWRLLDHALYQQYPTGQGQNRTPSVKKKTKSNRMSGGRLFIYGHSHTHQHTRRALARVSQWM